MPEIESSPETITGEARLLEQLYLPFLAEAQNADGGWGYRRGGQTSVEATSWVLLALLDTRPEACRRAASWLKGCQLPDGSWPAMAGQPRGCWVTALASLALYAHGGALDQVAGGLRWLARTWPAEGSLWWRIGARLFRRGRAAQHNVSLRGWSWTPGTASWVEPTSCALLAFRHIPGELHPRQARRRRRLAERMLFDRMCPGGGWNSGNPLIYGVAGVPRIGPTVWALLALQDHRDRPENCQSLDWLGQSYPQIHGPGSLALAHLCLEVYDRSVPALEPPLAELNSHNQFLGQTLAAAWATMALTRQPRWLALETQNSEFDNRNSHPGTRNSRGSN